MCRIAVDTSFIISLIIVREQTENAKIIFKELVENYDEIYVPVQVLAELVYILEGIHKHQANMNKISREKIREYGYSIMNTPKFRCEKTGEIKRALDMFVDKKISFGDALIAAHIIAKGIKRIVAFDTDYKQIEDIELFSMNSI